MIILDVFIRSMFLIRFWNYFYGTGIDIPRNYVAINKNIPVCRSMDFVDTNSLR